MYTDDEKLELVFTRTELIGSFYQDSILGYYNDLKNRLLKVNSWHRRVELSPISQIYTHKIVRFKERWTKEYWEETTKHLYRNNTDGEWIFEYQATYEKSFYLTKKDKEKFKPGDEYYLEKDLMIELRQERNGGEFYGFDEGGDDSPSRGANVKNFPKVPEDKLKSDLEYKVKYKKWIKEKNIDWLEGDLLELVVPWTASGEDYWRLEFEENYDSVNISQKDIDNYKQLLEESNQKYVDEYNNEIEKAKESWKN